MKIYNANSVNYTNKHDLSNILHNYCVIFRNLPHNSLHIPQIYFPRCFRGSMEIINVAVNYYICIIIN